MKRLFLDHPASVGESYGQHARVAMGFGVRMIAGGLAALVHGLVPALFERTGSTVVKALYARLARRQPDLAHDHPSWRPEYEI